jgi:hypothetical protein
MNIVSMTEARSKLLGVLAVASLAAYIKVLRPRQLRWGATDEEVAQSLPGDDVVDRPTFDATRAVTVEARPEQIWPWLVQIGFHRAGWYSYDWDNLFRPSVGRIVPELQHLTVGDIIPMGPGESSGLWVKDVEPNSWMLWWDKKGYTTWLWFLDPMDESRTRLITRVRAHYRWTSPSILFSLPMDVGDIIMMRKSMLGIKRRAEAMARSTNHVPESALR